MNKDYGIEPKASHARRHKAMVDSAHPSESEEEMSLNASDLEISDASSTTLSARSHETDFEGFSASDDERC